MDYLQTNFDVDFNKMNETFKRRDRVIFPNEEDIGSKQIIKKYDEYNLFYQYGLSLRRADSIF